ncbi:Antilisterial bacteriocin subtilosin biosynthesis protein AlbA [Anaerohalosphaera lusitana]|uniref:Pre-heme d1 synthase n=1 Tax=Anaerohalosphaera lusitana TaxID=1936003 RepID=A0A1U9NII2_9BACT|nr:radical SAM protein [Anaerohalosphaera lusitana]AQT67739.1 Antilisterial bacteriocin subtilosin biosynthesis protein AlbA [Anaerohalosphaera lusitana]
MINITRLYCDEMTPGDWIRYGRNGHGTTGKTDKLPTSARRRKPIVVWNITSKCNLRCVHCYNDSGCDIKSNEATTSEAKAVLDDLADFGVPSVLFSGGEPLMRDDLFELIDHARDKGLRTVISTNGTLITPERAAKINELGVSYVGISLDGIGEVNDQFRQVDGAFDRAVAGIRNCQNAGVRVGLRLTLTKRNVQDLDALFDFFEQENIERACFYHLVPSGRGKDISDARLTHEQSRHAVNTIIERTAALSKQGRRTDILTVDNHVDGVYLYRKLNAYDCERAEKVWQLLTWNGGGMNSSGIGIGCIDFNGKVHANQFWGHYDIGDIHERKFSDIWTDESDPLLKGLRDRRSNIKGRCRLCKYFDACGGSLRVRADLYFGDTWAPDPACYLTDKEIGLDDAAIQELKRSGELYDMPE